MQQHDIAFIIWSVFTGALILGGITAFVRAMIHESRYQAARIAREKKCEIDVRKMYPVAIAVHGPNGWWIYSRPFDGGFVSRLSTTRRTEEEAWECAWGTLSRPPTPAAEKTHYNE